MTYEELIAYIEELIYDNETNDITGGILQTVLKAISDFANSKEVDPDDVIIKEDGAFPFRDPIILYSGLSKLIRIEAADGVFYLKQSTDDGATWDDVIEINAANNTIKNFPFPLNRFYTAVELRLPYLAIDVDAEQTERITNIDNDAFIEIVACDIFNFTDDVLTVQNIPVGFKAWVRMNFVINFRNTEAERIEFQVNGKSAIVDVLTLNKLQTATLSGTYLVENTDTFVFNLYNETLVNYNINMHTVYADFELIKLEPII
jgi:hypothetical protein